MATKTELRGTYLTKTDKKEIKEHLDDLAKYIKRLAVRFVITFGIVIALLVLAEKFL